MEAGQFLMYHAQRSRASDEGASSLPDPLAGRAILSPISLPRSMEHRIAWRARVCLSGSVCRRSGWSRARLRASEEDPKSSRAFELELIDAEGIDRESLLSINEAPSSANPASPPHRCLENAPDSQAERFAHARRHQRQESCGRGPLRACTRHGGDGIDAPRQGPRHAPAL